MSKFIKTAKDKIMVKVNIDGLGDTWATCTQAVKDFAKKAFKEGDAVKVTYEAKPDAEVKYHVTRIEKGAGTDTKTGATLDTTGKPKCKDCGKELKDAKYEKCWACNKKNPEKKSDKGSDVNTSIKRQAIGHMTSRSLIAMQGQVEPNNIISLIETLYAKYKDLVG